MISNKIITFVIPWYGKDLVGGAESLCRNIVEHLHLAGYSVEVFTTCSQTFHSDWSNFYNEGTYEINEVKVRRFLADKRDISLFDSINYKLMNKIPISEKEELDWIENNINSSDMINAIKKEQENRIFLFIPYLYGTTFFGCQACPENSIMIPCFHDEGYVYMKNFISTFQKVRGMIFLSEPEKQLAENILHSIPENITPGGGVEIDSQGDGENFRKKFNVKNFLLYTGRKDPGKNVDLLIDYYCKFVEKNGFLFDLVLTGPGNIQIPEKFNKHIKSLLLSYEDLSDAYDGAFLTCQPSVNESFSLSIMESWLHSTPVLVHEKCQVTKNHCEKSNGGLYFSNFEEFESCINYFLQNKDKSKIFGKNGNQYVINNYSWNKIISKYVDFITRITN